MFKKHPILSAVLLFGFHLGFDIFSNMLPIADGLYRLLIFRYTAFIGAGILLYNNHNKIMEKRLIVYSLMVLSGLYIWMCNYYGYVPVIFSKWTVTSLPTVFWALGLVILGLKYLDKESKVAFSGLLRMAGKASFHIFLTQMVYFKFVPGIFGVVVNLPICIVVGIIFYHIEITVLERIRNSLKYGKYN